MILSAENIFKSYGKLHVLKGVSLEVDQGEVVSIVGKSGAGKSTLLHILGTLDKADEGKIFFNNENISSYSESQINTFRNQHIGFIFQFHHLLPEFTALENVTIPGRILNQSNQLEGRAKELLDYLGLKDRMSHKPSELSGGEQQRVAVARALMNSPKIVFADEPSGNLDTQTSEELHEMLFKLREDFNQSFVIVTHNMELAALSDRTLTMEDGLIVS